MKTLRPINIKKGKATNPNNSFFSEKNKELLGWHAHIQYYTVFSLTVHKQCIIMFIISHAHEVPYSQLNA